MKEGRADTDFFSLRNEKKPFDYDEISKLIHELYEAIADQIMSGDIRIEPTNGACKFCNFSSICHHDREDTIDKASMEVLTGKGGDDHAGSE